MNDYSLAEITETLTKLGMSEIQQKALLETLGRAIWAEFLLKVTSHISPEVEANMPSDLEVSKDSISFLKDNGVDTQKLFAESVQEVTRLFLEEAVQG